MRPKLRIFLIAALLTAAFAGCAASPWAAKSDSDADSLPAAGPSLPVTPSGIPAAIPTPGPPVPSPVSSTSPQSLQDVMGEIERIGRVDPRAQAQLLEELKQTDPSLWPMAVKSVWSRVAYARRFQQEQQQGAQLADRRSGDVENHVKQINLNQDYAPEYPATSATVESPLPDIGPSANVVPVERAGYGNERRDNNRPSTSDPGRATAPPWPTQGAAINANAAQHTAEKRESSGVVYTSYLAEKTPHNGPVKRDASDKPDWKTSLQNAITTLEGQLAGDDAGSGGATASAGHARLRMLQLIAGQRDAALSEMPIDDAAMRDFWSKELYGLDVLLGSGQADRDRHRAAEAKRHLCDAVLALGESAILEVRNMAFCSEVQSYGSIKQFEKHEFLPGQRVLLYAEVDNFRSENTPQGYHTSLRSSFQIFDDSGCRVDRRESTTTEEHCQSPRRDYFIGCDFCMPADIKPGRHTLKLTVEDLKSHKVGESSIGFTIAKR